MNSLEQITLASQSKFPSPPIESWDPPLSGVMDLRIARDGTWWYEGSPIRRTALVRLFSSILRRESDDCYYLVTPAEKWRIQIDDAPFLAVFLTIETGNRQRLHFQTNLGDTITAGSDHPLQVVYASDTGEPSPYVLVRNRLWALITRNVFFELAELAEERDLGDKRVYGVWSDDMFFSLGEVEH